MKKLLIALAVAAPIALGIGGINGAEAKTKVNIYLGIPYYSHQVGPDYVYRKGHGWYRPGRNVNRLSCGQARRIVNNRGYYGVVPRNCNGQTYVFRALKNNRAFVVYVNARTGAVWRG
jgi:hypothetical protein